MSLLASVSQNIGNTCRQRLSEALLPVRWSTNVLTFGIYCSMETYGETVTSLTKKRDCLSREDNLGTQINTQNVLKATYDMV